MSHAPSSPSPESGRCRRNAISLRSNHVSNGLLSSENPLVNRFHPNVTSMVFVMVAPESRPESPSTLSSINTGVTNGPQQYSTRLPSTQDLPLSQFSLSEAEASTPLHMRPGSVHHPLHPVTRVQPSQSGVGIIQVAGFRWVLSPAMELPHQQQAISPALASTPASQPLPRPGPMIFPVSTDQDVHIVRIHYGERRWIPAIRPRRPRNPNRYRTRALCRSLFWSSDSEDEETPNPVESGNDNDHPNSTDSIGHESSSGSVVLSLFDHEHGRAQASSLSSVEDAEVGVAQGQPPVRRTAIFIREGVHMNYLDLFGIWPPGSRLLPGEEFPHNGSNLCSCTCGCGEEIRVFYQKEGRLEDIQGLLCRWCHRHCNF